MAQLVLHFGWTWVGTIAADDDYGKYGIKDFKEQVEEAGVCISFSETLPKVNLFLQSLYHKTLQLDQSGVLNLVICLHFR